jgi:hypothetical protein
MAPGTAKIYRYKQKLFYNAELLCEEVENHIYSMHQN